MLGTYCLPTYYFMCKVLIKKILLFFHFIGGRAETERLDNFAEGQVLVNRRAFMKQTGWYEFLKEPPGFCLCFEFFRGVAHSSQFGKMRNFLNS